MVERGRLTNGTTWHAAGLVSRVRGTHALTALTARQRRDVRARSARDRHRDGPPAGRGADDRPDRGADGRDPRRRRRWRATSASRSRSTDRARIRELWPSAVVDDLVGGVLFPIGRDGQPGRRGAGVREGRRGRRARATCPRPTVTGFRFAAADWSPRDRVSTHRAARSRRRPWSWPPACGRASWRGWPAPASRSIPPSTSGS